MRLLRLITARRCCSPSGLSELLDLLRRLEHDTGRLDPGAVILSSLAAVLLQTVLAPWHSWGNQWGQGQRVKASRMKSERDLNGDSRSHDMARLV